MTKAEREMLERVGQKLDVLQVAVTQIADAVGSLAEAQDWPGLGQQMSALHDDLSGMTRLLADTQMAVLNSHAVGV